MLAKCFFVRFLSITSPVSRKPRMWSPTYTGTALSESPANQVTVRFVEFGSRDAPVCALKHAARALLKQARLDASESRFSFPWCAGDDESWPRIFSGQPVGSLKGRSQSLKI